MIVCVFQALSASSHVTTPICCQSGLKQTVKSILTMIWPSLSSYSLCLCSHLLCVCREPASVSDWTVNSCRSHNEANDSSIIDFQWPQLGQLKLYAGYNYVFYWWGRNDGLGNDMWQLYKPPQALHTSKGRGNRQQLILRSDLHSNSIYCTQIFVLKN